MDWLLPMLVIADVPRSQRAAIIEQLLPMTLPLPSAALFAVTAMNAERQLAQHLGIERQMLEEAVKAAGFKSASDLDAHPALKEAFERQPAEVQTALFRRSPSPAKASAS